MKLFPGITYQAWSGHRLLLRHYVRVGSKNVEETTPSSRGVIKKTPPSTSLPNSSPKQLGEESSKRQNLLHHRFNLFEDVGQREEANFSTSTCSDTPTKIFPFNSRHVGEIVGISRVLLKDDCKLLPAMILMGPSHPVSQSKLPYFSFTQQLAKEINAQMIDLPLDKLRRLALLTHPQRIQSPEESFFQSVNNINARPNGFKRMSPALNSSSVSGYLQSIKSIWSWVQDSLAKTFPGNRVLFMPGLAELLDTPAPFRHEVILFLKSIKQAGTLIVDGTSSGALKISPPHTPVVRREKSSLEQLIMSIQSHSFATNTRLLPADESKASNLQKVLDEYVSKEAPSNASKKEAVQEREERSIVIAETIVWAPLGLPIEGGVTRLGRGIAQKDSQDLVRLLEEDNKRHVSLEQYQVVSSELAKLASTDLPHTLNEVQTNSLIATNIYTINDLNRSHIQRILLACPSGGDAATVAFDDLIEALKSLNLQAPPVTNPMSLIAHQEFTKHESRFINAIVTPGKHTTNSFSNLFRQSEY